MLLGALNAPYALPQIGRIKLLLGYMYVDLFFNVEFTTMLMEKQTFLYVGQLKIVVI